MDVIVRTARRAFRVTEAKEFRVTDGRLEVVGAGGEHNGEVVAFFAPGAWRAVWYLGSARPIATARARRAAAARPGVRRPATPAGT